MPDKDPLVQMEMETEDDLYHHVLYSLGSPHIRVELDRMQFRSFLKQTLSIYSRYSPKFRFFGIPAYAGQQHYELNKETIGYGLVDVYIPRIDPIAPLLLSSGPRLDIFGYRYSYPYRDINEIYTDYMYFKEATRILSANFEWEYKDGALRIHPKPDETFTMTYVSAFPHSLDSLPMDDMDWVRDRVLAESKIAVGSVRRKFSIPGAQTPQVMDGQQLVQEGRQELMQLTIDIKNRVSGSLPIMRT